MIKQVALIMKFVVIAIIYIVLFRIIKIMYLDLKGIKSSDSKDTAYNYALEVQDAPDSINISKGSVYPVRLTTNIGRKDDNHIILDDPFVSGSHASLFIEDGRLYIRDLNSTNGTFKNGSKVEDVEELFDGDILEIGRIIFKVIG